MTNTDNKTLNLRTVSRCYISTTKRWWIVTWILRLAIFVAAIPAVWWPELSFVCAIFVGALSLISEFCSIVTMQKKSYAEGILRKLDLQGAFGWEIKNDEVADLLENLSKRDRKRVDVTDLPDDYFASTNEHGWRRGIENLQRSRGGASTVPN